MKRYKTLDELIPTPEGKLLYPRSGLVVKHFEVVGLSHKGKRTTAIYLPTIHSFKLVAKHPLHLGVKRMRLEDNSSILLEQVGNQRELEKFLRKIESREDQEESWQ